MLYALDLLDDLNMKKYEKILSAIKEQSPLLKMIQLGLKPEQIKEAVIETLEPYFYNKDVLERLAVVCLIPDSISLLRLQEDTWSFKMFKKCLTTYGSAKTNEPQRCFESCALWQPQILQSVSKFWSVLHLEVDKSTLGIEDLLHECLSNIVDVIEALMKPYLKALLHQARTAKGITSTLGDIDSLDLGKIIDELIQTTDYPDLFMPPPWNIKLNQWRNIAAHHTAKTDDGMIICWYGKAPNIKEIQLYRDELLQVVHTIFNLYRTVKLAHDLFFVDNIKEIEKFSPAEEGLRDEAEFLNLATSLASQGFEIVEYNRNEDEAKLVIRDFSDYEPKKRRFHASQFVLFLWVVTRSRKLVVEYRERDGTPNLLAKADSTICKMVYSGELEPSSLAQKMELVDLKR